MKLLYSHVHRKSPGNGRGAWKSIVAYRDLHSEKLIESYSDTSGRDRYDDHIERFSEDGGKTWGEPRLVIPSREVRRNVVIRGIETFLDNDTATGRVFRGYNEATFYDDDLDESVEDSHAHSTLFVQYSLDGGDTYEPAMNLTEASRSSATFQSNDPDIELHPLVSCTHMQTLPDGTLLIPVIRWASSRSGRNGAWADAGYSQTGSCMAIGRWNHDLSSIFWRFGNVIPQSTDIRTNGISEVSITPWKNGDLLAVARMDPWNSPHEYSCKWWSLSSDQGKTWTVAKPLRGTDGDEVFSPATNSRVMQHSSGKTLLITNLYDHPCQGLGPRYALHIAELSPDAHGQPSVVRSSITTIDQRRSHELSDLALSNFTAYEDRATAEVRIYCPRVYAREFTLEDSDCMIYSVQV